MKISLILPSFMRPHLLELGLWSLTHQRISYDFEIVVCNDGVDDDTQSICNDYMKHFDIKYFFSGQINEHKFISRNPCFATNIAVKQSTGNIIILSTPEIFHLNSSINLLVEPLVKNGKIMTTPNFIFFDGKGDVINYLSRNKSVMPNQIGDIPLPDHLYREIENEHSHTFVTDASEMDYFLALHKDKFMEIGGFDEDFTGYAGQDNDLTNRLQLNGLHYLRTKSRVIHLYHGGENDGQMHTDNPDWAYNYNLLLERKNIIVRNKNRKWGELENG